MFWLQWKANRDFKKRNQAIRFIFKSSLLAALWWKLVLSWIIVRSRKIWRYKWMAYWWMGCGGRQAVKSLGCLLGFWLAELSRGLCHYWNGKEWGGKNQIWRNNYFEHAPNWDNYYTTIWKCTASNGIYKLGTCRRHRGWRYKVKGN